MHWERNFDVGITGAGPAGLALAAALRERGASVAVVDPAPEAEWVPTWCGYADELPDTPVAQRWPKVRVALDSGERIREREYIRVDGTALKAQLLARAEGVVMVESTVSGVDDGKLVLHDGRHLSAQHLVDCSGGAQVLGKAGEASAFQTAYGLDIETEGHPWAPDTATWMDLTALETPPSFLYVLPTDENRVFVEETSLAARPAVPLDVLERRLRERLDRMGVVVKHVHHVERCVIPMDLPVPDGLAFGAAGGMIHPASGYVLARVLHTAPELAVALLEGDPYSVLHGARGGFARSLHLLGLDVLTGANGPALAAFFSAFFDQPQSRRDDFLSPQTPLRRTVLSMLRVFATAPGATRRQLAAPLFRTRHSEAECPAQ